MKSIIQVKQKEQRYSPEKRVAILGSTGSIGTQTLDVIGEYPDRFAPTLLVAGTKVDTLIQQALRWRPEMAIIADESKYWKLKDALEPHGIATAAGQPAINDAMEADCFDTVVTATVGYSGLAPTMRAISAGKDIALANKETLVTAGHLIMPLAREYGVSLLPVDSEHSAIFQCLQSGSCEEIEEIFLTASGGPFRHSTEEELERVTMEQALAHPNWSMGKKITIDSATMINKGLEIIEACWLFHVGLEQVHVLVQPKSIIHSMVGFRDGAVMAQLGTPDMRLPIQYALMYPERPQLSGERLNFEKLKSIHFEEPNTKVLRGLDLAKRSFETGGSMTTVMNAANEFAVAKFLNKEIGFTDIYRMIEYAMEHHSFIKNPSLDDILETEKETCSILEKCYV